MRPVGRVLNALCGEGLERDPHPMNVFLNADAVQADLMLQRALARTIRHCEAGIGYLLAARREAVADGARQ